MHPGCILDMYISYMGSQDSTARKVQKGEIVNKQGVLASNPALYTILSTHFRQYRAVLYFTPPAKQVEG